MTQAEIKGLVKWVDAGATADATELGLDSKFQLEVLNLHLLTKCGLVLLKVRGMEPYKSRIRRVYMILMESYIELYIESCLWVYLPRWCWC